MDMGCCCFGDPWISETMDAGSTDTGGHLYQGVNVSTWKLLFALSSSINMMKRKMFSYSGHFSYYYTASIMHEQQYCLFPFSLYLHNCFY